MYSLETKARIEHIRTQLPLLPDDAANREGRMALMREAVQLMREGRVSASISSATAKARKAKAVVVNGDDLLADLEP